MIPHLKRFWFLYGSTFGSAFLYILPGVQAIIAQHPHSTWAYFAGLAIGAYFATSPTDHAIVNAAKVTAPKDQIGQ